MLFFFSLFDAVISYVTPLIMTQNGLSVTQMGIIYGTAAISGAAFDFILAKYLKSSHYRKIYLAVFAICFVYPLILWQSKVIWLYLIAMALWGIYYDLINFGTFDFVGRETKKEDHAQNFGIVDVFKSAGYLIGPILAGILIGKLVDLKVFILAWISLSVSFALYLALTALTKKSKITYMRDTIYKHKNMALELRVWKKVGLSIFPVLILIVFLNIYDAFFWTIGPLYSESLSSLHPLGGLFMSFYTAPSLIVGWFIGNIVKKYGRTKTPFLAFLLGSLVLLLFPVVKDSPWVLLLVVASSILTSISFTSIKSRIVDFITSKPQEEKEIEGVGDFSVNIGYVVGPMVAGFLSDKVGNANSFLALGIAGIVVSGALLLKKVDK